MNNRATKRASRILILVFILSLIIGALFVFTSCKPTAPTTKDEIISSVEAGPKEGKKLSECIVQYGVNVSKNKLNSAESIYKQYYYKTIPAASELAHSAMLIFAEKYIDTVDLADRTAVTDAILNSYVEAIGDPYSNYFTKEQYKEYVGSLSGDENKVGIGVMIEANYQDVTLRVTSVLPGSSAEAAGVKKGDYIIGVDGKYIEDEGIDGLYSLISGDVGTEVKIHVRRGGEELVLTAIRIEISDVTVVYEMMENKLAYIQVIQFKETTTEQFRKAVDDAIADGAVGIVFDMRDNPGGLLDSVVAMIDYIVPDGKRIASYTIAKNAPTIYTSKDGHSVDLPITVLCNGGTASAGELFTAAMRDYGKDGTLDVRIIGENTYKKGVMQTSIEIYDGTAIKLTVAFYNPPCDINYDGVGVIPDVEVPTPETDEVDTQLERAITELLSLIEQKNASQE